MCFIVHKNALKALALTKVFGFAILVFNLNIDLVNCGLNIGLGRDRSVTSVIT